MSTEATGDGRTDAVGAGGPSVAAEGTNLAAPAAGQEAAEVPPDEAAEPPGAVVPPEAIEPSGAIDPPEAADRTGNDAGEADEAVDFGEAEDSDEPPADDEGFEYDGDYEEYDEQEPQEAVEPQRARRWPRVLLVLGFVGLAVVIVGGAVVIVGSVTHGFKKPVKVTYKKSALFSLKAGECFNPQGQSYSLVSCESPHDAEVFATFALSGSTWPGATTIAQEAGSGCASRLTGYLNPQLAISLSSTYVYPDSVAWQAGTKTVICEVRATSGQLTGSVRKASATAG